MVDTYFAINPIENWPSYLDIENEILTYPANSINSTTNTVVGDSTEESKNTEEVKKDEGSEILSY